MLEDLVLAEQIRTLRFKYGNVMTRETLRTAYNHEGWTKWANSKIVKNRAFQYREHAPYLYVLSVVDLGELRGLENVSQNAVAKDHKHRAVMAYLAGTTFPDVMEKYLTAAPKTFISDNLPPRFSPKKIDWAQVNKEKAEIGLAGEEWLCGLFRQRLLDQGHPELAAKIVHVSKNVGDGAGFDILAFDTLGNKIFVEVKTTRGETSAPFYISSNELAFSRENGAKFLLYRIFNWNDVEGKFWYVPGPLDDKLKLEPITFSASLSS